MQIRNAINVHLFHTFLVLITFEYNIHLKLTILNGVRTLVNNFRVYSFMIGIKLNNYQIVD